MSIVSAVKNVMSQKQIVVASVAHRYELTYVNGPKDMGQEQVAGFYAQVLEALEPVATWSKVETLVANKQPFVALFNLAIAGVELPAISKPQAPLDALKDAFKRDSKKRKAKAPKNKLVEDMEEDEGLAGDGEIEDLEAPRSDLEDL